VYISLEDEDKCLEFMKLYLVNGDVESLIASWDPPPRTLPDPSVRQTPLPSPPVVTSLPSPPVVTSLPSPSLATSLPITTSIQTIPSASAPERHLPTNLLNSSLDSLESLGYSSNSNKTSLVNGNKKTNIWDFSGVNQVTSSANYPSSTSASLPSSSSSVQSSTSSFWGFTLPSSLPTPSSSSSSHSPSSLLSDEVEEVKEISSKINFRSITPNNNNNEQETYNKKEAKKGKNESPSLLEVPDYIKKNVITTVKQEGTKKGAHWVWDCNKAPPGMYEDTMTSEEKEKMERRTKDESTRRKRRRDEWGDDDDESQKNWGDEKQGVCVKNGPFFLFLFLFFLCSCSKLVNRYINIFMLNIKMKCVYVLKSVVGVLIVVVIQKMIWREKEIETEGGKGERKT
jgi:hypothetical protein